VTFLDTGFLFALVSKKDAHHARVVEVFRTFSNLRLANHLLTTNHVIAETITLTLKVFVDCLSFVVMEKLGIREALAVDSDFTHRFIARPGPHG
jgi:predicted nucleic acid-binding protein